MANTLVIREKTTSDIVMTLEADGTAINLTGVNHIRLDMIDAKNNIYRYSSADVSPAIVITTPASGIVTFTPPTEAVFQYLNSPYELYIWVYETASKKYAVPERDQNIIKLTREF